MRKATLLALAVLLLPALLALFPGRAKAAPDKFVILTEELPPFNFKTQDGVRGISTDILLRMVAFAGLKGHMGDIQIQPWARAYDTVRNKPGTLLYSVARTKEREDLFKWVGPIISVRSSLIARKDRRISLQTLDDAQKYSLGVIRKYPTTQFLLAAGYPAEKIETAPDAKANLMKLQTGRIDLFAYNDMAFEWMITELGLDKDDFEAVYPLYDVQFYYAINKDTPDELVSKLQESLDTLKKTGEVQRIIDEYLK
ncbi:MAG: ABC transporter substrate-binding protein [Desulfovibrio sp.]|jgi:polar amino acid transport system substrate-binding protein|nr:ABC transporter substrate-binding protein [Desulfovibrio sp.]MBI4959528.1 ABC transporter substrate-binding protein [Desulfovibrio sp.]